MKIGPLALFLSLFACAPASETPDREPAAAPAAKPDTASVVASLAGGWRVAGIDGRPFNENYGLAIEGNAREIWWVPRCAGIARSYRIDGHVFEAGPSLAERGRQSGEATPVCAIGLPPQLDAVTRAIDSATQIARTANNGVELSGGGHSLLLFSQ